eukprot:GILJ01002608.1.p1 GENE.GILJ01002608.1~~GILJ01002608.1.p1  ORF type:complete len:249 (-),score=32.12 GILJ01002608.1:51-797(-)
MTKQQCSNTLIFAISLVLEDSFVDPQSPESATYFTDLPPELSLFLEDALLDTKSYLMDKMPSLAEAVQRQPTVHDLQVFFHTLVQEFHFSESVLVCSLVYIMRFLAFYKRRLHVRIWRPLAICAVLVAHKILEDVPFRNSEFVDVYPLVSAEELLSLELTFCAALRFQLSVQSATYDKYIQELDALYRETCGQLPQAEACSVSSASNLNGNDDATGGTQSKPQGKFKAAFAKLFRRKSSVRGKQLQAA